MVRPVGLEDGILKFVPLLIDPCLVVSDQCYNSIGVVQEEPWKPFFMRMIRDVEFRMFYSYMRLTYSRIFMSLLRRCSRQNRIE